MLGSAKRGCLGLLIGLLLLVIARGILLQLATPRHYSRILRSVQRISGRGAWTPPACRPMAVAHSDKGTPGAIMGNVGDIVRVQCNEGYSGSGKVTCRATGQFTVLNCTAIQPQRIAVATLCIGAAGQRLGFVLHHFALYCRRHGYALEVQRTPLVASRPAHWSKLPAIRRLLDRYDFVFWMDLDSLFTNPTLKIEQAIAVLEAGPRDVLVSGDSNIVNTGHMLFRASAWSRRLLQDAVRVYPADIGNADNAALSILLAGCTPLNTSGEWQQCYRRSDRGYEDWPTHEAVAKADMRAISALGVPLRIRRHVAWAPQRFMNSYPFTWKDGDWILHFAGCAEDEKVRLMKQSLERIQET